MFTFHLASVCAFLFAASHLWAADAVSPQTLRYTILSNGRTAGSDVEVYNPGGHIDCTFEFNDRGRGPKVAAHYNLTYPQDLALSEVVCSALALIVSASSRSGR
jgi:hypothetical protein